MSAHQAVGGWLENSAQAVFRLP